MTRFQPLRAGGYELDVLLQGFPGKALHHGGLGWSTVALLRGHGHTVIVDTGSFGMRRPLLEQFAARGLKPDGVSDVLLTHAHHDHCVNWTLFPKARVVIGKHELEVAAKDPWGATPTPELYVRGLMDWPSLSAAEDGAEVLPGIRCHMMPGHTHGHLIFRLEDAESTILFTGDAAKNRAELISREADMTYDAALSAVSIGKIWELWQRRPGTVLVPGHDIAMVLEDGVCRYLAGRDAAIAAWFGYDLKAKTVFDLTEK